MLEENGKLMRITRETLGYSYSQVEEATKVRELYLQLLESGDLAQMPGHLCHWFRRYLRAFFGYGPSANFGGR